MPKYVDPDRTQFEAFKALPRDTPINMLNLIKLNEVALYEDGSSCSGLEAYKRYGEETGPIFSGLGGTIIWRGKPEAILMGPSDEQWDIGFIARYPDAAAFLAMVTNPDYQVAVKHRQAAVLTSRLIRFGELPISENFAH
ncbi:MAG: DUF1330 domain-containing protein [Pseudomonadota bacterium]